MLIISPECQSEAIIQILDNLLVDYFIRHFFAVSILLDTPKSQRALRNTEFIADGFFQLVIGAGAAQTKGPSSRVVHFDGHR